MNEEVVIFLFGFTRKEVSAVFSIDSYDSYISKPS